MMDEPSLERVLNILDLFDGPTNLLLDLYSSPTTTTTTTTQ